MVRKKEDPEKVKARVKKYLKTKQQLLITGLTEEEKESFMNIPELDNLSHAKKLLTLVEFWKKNHAQEPVEKPKPRTILGVPVKENYSPKPARQVKKDETRPEISDNKGVSIDNWNKFEKDFNDFLFDYKASNRTRSKLRTHGQFIRDDLEAIPEFKKAFQKICEKLPESILKNFKPMFRQGYFYLYEKEIIEIAQSENRDHLLLLLFESLRLMVKEEEPVKEARKVLGILTTSL